MLVPHTGALFAALCPIFEEALVAQRYTVLEETLTAMASIAAVSETGFAQYYAAVGPGLKHLLTTLPANSEQNIAIRIKVLECLGYFLVAVRNEREVFQ